MLTKETIDTLPCTPWSHDLRTEVRDTLQRLSSDVAATQMLLDAERDTRAAQERRHKAEVQQLRKQLEHEVMNVANLQLEVAELRACVAELIAAGSCLGDRSSSAQFDAWRAAVAHAQEVAKP